jgi:hypothetical protein
MWKNVSLLSCLYFSNKLIVCVLDGSVPNFHYISVYKYIYSSWNKSSICISKFIAYICIITFSKFNNTYKSYICIIKFGKTKCALEKNHLDVPVSSCNFSNVGSSFSVIPKLWKLSIKSEVIKCRNVWSQAFSGQREKLSQLICDSSVTSQANTRLSADSTSNPPAMSTDIRD